MHVYLFGAEHLELDSRSGSSSLERTHLLSPRSHVYNLSFRGRSIEISPTHNGMSISAIIVRALLGDQLPCHLQKILSCSRCSGPSAAVNLPTLSSTPCPKLSM